MNLYLWVLSSIFLELKDMMAQFNKIAPSPVTMLPCLFKIWILSTSVASLSTLNDKWTQNTTSKAAVWQVKFSDLADQTLEMDIASCTWQEEKIPADILHVWGVMTQS